MISVLAGAFGAWLVLTLSPERTVNTAKNLATSTDETEVVAEFVPTSDQEGLIVETVERVQPAVVSIVVSKNVPVVERFFEDVNPFGNNFGPFNLRVPRLQQRGTELREVGGGTGFLVSVDGLVVTNRHVVADEEATYTAFRQDGTKHDVEVVARDPVHDLAILRIAGDDFPFVTFANSEALRTGQSVVAIGNALSEFENSVSVGVISGLSRSIVAGGSSGRAEQLEEVIQTDAAINPGNSGGPLLNLRGEVVGVNVAVALGSENIGFALPANLVKAVVDSVVETGRIVRPFIGVRYTDITPIVQEQNNLSVDYGVLLVRGETVGEPAVIPGSPANKAGLLEGDIILEVNGERLDVETTLAQIVGQRQVGDVLQFTVLSKGEEKTVDVTLEEFEQE